MKLATFLMLLAALAFGAGCGDDSSKTDDQDKGANHDGGDHHEEGDDPDGHEDGDEDHHAGDAKHPLGTQEVGALSVSVTLFGHVESGEETHMDIDITGGTVDAVRGWIGDKSGKGSLRAMIGGTDGHHHGHLEVPEKLGADAALWIEIQVGDTRTPLQFKLPTEN